MKRKYHAPRTAPLIVVLVMAVAAVTLLVCVGTFLQSYRAAVVQSARTSSAQAVSQVVGTVSNYVQNLEGTINDVMAEMDTPEESRDAYLNAWLNARSEVVAVTTYDSEGNLQLVTLNTSLLNKIGTEIAKRVNNDIYYEEADKIRLSLGSLLGSRLLSQTGPYFTFDIVPVAVINVGYKTEFESTGINQSKYKVYLDVKTETRLTVPFMSEKFETVNTVLIAEAVIVGEVPGTYTNIPEEDVSELVPG